MIAENKYKKYDENRKNQPRFGGRCSIEQKQKLSELSKIYELTEKDLIFTAIEFFENNMIK